MSGPPQPPPYRPRPSQPHQHPSSSATSSATAAAAANAPPPYQPRPPQHQQQPPPPVHHQHQPYQHHQHPAPAQQPPPPQQAQAQQPPPPPPVPLPPQAQAPKVILLVNPARENHGADVRGGGGAFEYGINWTSSSIPLHTHNNRAREEDGRDGGRDQALAAARSRRRRVSGARPHHPQTHTHSSPLTNPTPHHKPQLQLPQPQHRAPHPLLPRAPLPLPPRPRARAGLPRTYLETSGHRFHLILHTYIPHSYTHTQAKSSQHPIVVLISPRRDQTPQEWYALQEAAPLGACVRASTNTPLSPQTMYI